MKMVVLGYMRYHSKALEDVGLFRYETEEEAGKRGPSHS